MTEKTARRLDKKDDATQPVCVLFFRHACYPPTSPTPDCYVGWLMEEKVIGRGLEFVKLAHLADIET